MYSSEEKEVIVFDLGRVVISFSKAFGSTFSTSKKAHFDCLPPKFKVVDGARLKWCNLLLLDAAIAILDNEYINTSTRRAFNQQKVLHDAILKEFRINHLVDSTSMPQMNSAAIKKHIDSTGTITKKTYCYHRDSIVPLTLDIELFNVCAPWDTMRSLIQSMLDTPTTKSRQKYLKIVDLLKTHSALVKFENNLAEVLKAVIKKILAARNATIQKQLVSTFVSNLPLEGESVKRCTRNSSQVQDYSTSSLEIQSVFESGDADKVCFKPANTRTSRYGRMYSEGSRVSAVDQLMARGSRSHADAAQLLHNSRYMHSTLAAKCAQEASSNRWKSSRKRSLTREEESGSFEELKCPSFDMLEGTIAPPATPIKRRKTMTSASDGCTSTFDTDVSQLQTVFSPPHTNSHKNDDPLPHWNTYEKMSHTSYFEDSAVDQCDQDFWEHLHGLLENSNIPFDRDQNVECLTDSCSNSTTSGDALPAGLSHSYPSWCVPKEEEETSHASEPTNDVSSDRGYYKSRFQSFRVIESSSSVSETIKSSVSACETLSVSESGADHAHHFVVPSLQSLRLMNELK